MKLSRASKIKKDFPTMVIALRDPKTPLIAKGLVVLTIVYVLSPIDIIPDISPLVGLLDDIAIVPMLLGLATKFVPEGIWEQSRIKAKKYDRFLNIKWYHVVALLLLILFLIYLIIQATIA